MGIRKKIFFGFVIIGLILFMSGIISLYQLVQIEKTVVGMHSDNIRSIEISQEVLNETESQTWRIIDIIHGRLEGNEAELYFNDDLYTESFELMSQNITSDIESKIVDTLFVQYQLYKNQVFKLDSLFFMGNPEKRSYWFDTYYRPVYTSFKKTIQNLSKHNQDIISENSYKLESNFYRMIIPLIVAVAVGMFLIILFNYFINLYFISPILKIIKGMKAFSENKVPYNVKVDTQDEIGELNKEIKLLVSHSKQKESSTGIFDFKK